MTKKLLRKLLVAYKPLDARFRSIGPYARLSRLLQARYSAMMSPEGSARASGLDAQAYIENFDRVAPRADTILFECYWGKKFADNPLAMYRACCAASRGGGSGFSGRRSRARCRPTRLPAIPM